MHLPFRYQFLLAPAVIIMLLAGLVTYTLVELPRINREHGIPRQWELAMDRALVTIATADNLDRLTRKMIATPIERNALLFDYIEQTQIYMENALHPELLAHAPEDIRKLIKQSAYRLQDSEHVDPTAVQGTLISIMPVLKHLSATFQSQRRTALMGYHRDLRIIVSQLINASLTVLLVCIVLGVGLATWGLHVTRRRLAGLTQRAHSVCAGDLTPYPTPISVRDELDTLDQCLAVMTQRLIDTVAVEKILQGAEDERRRIAMDMHDGVLSDLTTVSRTLDYAESTQPNTPIIAQLRVNMGELGESIRRIIEDLHPQSLEILGLEAALRSFFARYDISANFPSYSFEFDRDVEKALRSAQKIHLFRIVSEATNNVIRHAQCTRFEVSVRVVAQHLLCSVEDNGIGMPVANGGQGHGCLNIAERARAIGAHTSWTSSRFSTGTRFELRLPLTPSLCLA